MRLREPPYRTILIAFAVAASITAVLSLPSERETLALHERDGKIFDALNQINRTLLAGNRDKFVLDTAVRMHLHLGDVDSAASAAELLAASYPESLAAQTTLLNLIRERGQHDRYLALAERIYDRWREPQLLRDLLDIYRLWQNSEAETRLLELATATGHATAADIERLGMIKAAQGDYASAIQLLSDGDGTREGIERNAQATLFRLLIEQNRFEEAVRRATKWFAAQRDDSAAAQFCSDLALSRNIERAMAITRQVGTREDEVYIACAERVLRWGDADLTASLLVTWVAEDRITGGETVDRFVQLALRVARPDLALTLWSRVKSYVLLPATCLDVALEAAALEAQERIDLVPPQAQRFLARHVPALQARLLQDATLQRPTYEVASGQKSRVATIEALRRLKTALNGSAPPSHERAGLAEEAPASSCEGAGDDH
jgi:hypothetical protein